MTVMEENEREYKSSVVSLLEEIRNLLRRGVELKEAQMGRIGEWWCPRCGGFFKSGRHDHV